MPAASARCCVAGDYIHCEHARRRRRSSPARREGSATYAQYLLKPDWLLPPIPDGVSYEHASLACCGAGPVVRRLRSAWASSAFDTVLITGLGPVGLGAVVNARFRGARVIAVESHALPRASARCEMGAEAVLDPRDERRPAAHHAS